MESAALSPFAAWEAFYVIVGPSAAALTGLQFVVIALGADRRAVKGVEILAFGSPTVVHFCAVLLIAATLSAPWHALSGPRLIFALSGLAGIVYVGIVLRRTRRQPRYKVVMEDLVWHLIIPFLAYAGLFASAVELGRHSTGSLFAIAAVALVLLFAGIHNAWDAATYIALDRKG